MADKIPIPTPTMNQKVNMTMKFNDAFGVSWKDMRKEQLGLMILNQTANVNASTNELLKGYKIYSAIKRQRDYYLKLIRKYNDK